MANYRIPEEAFVTIIEAFKTIQNAFEVTGAVIPQVAIVGFADPTSPAEPSFLFANEEADLDAFIAVLESKKDVPHKVLSVNETEIGTIIMDETDEDAPVADYVAGRWTDGAEDQ